MRYKCAYIHMYICNYGIVYVPSLKVNAIYTPTFPCHIDDDFPNPQPTELHHFLCVRLRSSKKSTGMYTNQLNERAFNVNTNAYIYSYVYLCIHIFITPRIFGAFSLLYILHNINK